MKIEHIYYILKKLLLTFFSQIKDLNYKDDFMKEVRFMIGTTGNEDIWIAKTDDRNYYTTHKRMLEVDTDIFDETLGGFNAFNRHK